jgi:hypothetical protein
MNWRRRARELSKDVSQALFSRDGFDDEAAWQFGSRGALAQCGVHEGNDFGIVESGRASEPKVTSNIAASEKAVLGIANASALKEAEADLAGIENDREDGV